MNQGLAGACPSIDKSAENFRDKILRKCGESVEMKEKFFAKYAAEIETLSREMAERFSRGHKLLTMGNGGSLCDALHFAVEFTHPIIEKLRLLGQPGDIALAVSTSGKSPNLIYALEEARKKQMLTVAWAGKDGGRFPEVADYCFIVPSYSIHRIQEVHATLVHVLWDLTHIALGAEDVI